MRCLSQVFYIYMQRTEISSLGEFALIKRLTRDFPIQHESTRRGVGDDAAVIAYPEGLQTLVTTDLLLEGIHFDLTYTPLRHLGYKAAVGSFSDIYAMNGHPQQLTCSIGVSARFAVEDLEELYAGIRLACSRYGVDLVGGGYLGKPHGALYQHHLSGGCSRRGDRLP